MSEYSDMNFRVCLTLLTIAAAPWAADSKRSIAETDLYGFQWIAGAQISPDGSKVAYTHIRTTQKRDTYETALWMAPAAGGAPRPLTGGTQDSEARWSPDGRTSVPRGQPAQIWLLSMDGGEARQLTEMPKAAGAPVWAPNGKSIAFSSTAIAKDFDKTPDARAMSA